MRSCPYCFKILSNKNRTTIVSLLRKGEQRVNDLLERLNIGQSTVSHHIAKLKKIRMVKAEKRGREIFYFLNKKYPCKNCNIFAQIKR